MSDMVHWKGRGVLERGYIGFRYDDGGREAAGFSGSTGDCVVRSIAIATEVPYREVYDALFERGREYGASRRGRVAERLRRSASPRDGVFPEVYKPYLTDQGWEWTPTMHVGSGCTVHLHADELPEGRLVVAVSKHYTALIDGVLHDTYDCSRGGTRCVYGYWRET